MTIVFDGKKFASEREKELKLKVSKLKIKPKLVSILVGNDKASLLYTNLKKKTAERIGIKFEIKKFPPTILSDELIDVIDKLNKDTKVNGIMVQLPLPVTLKSRSKSILNSILKEKDVDGLTRNSPYTAAAVKAIKEIIDYATKPLPYFGKKSAVIGAKGTVGKAVVEFLHKMGYKVSECDKDTRDLYAKLTGVDLVVSAVGEPGLIKGEMIKEGVIAIDVGAPLGDLDFEGVSKRASFVTPVPGGVGPVTIICLMENLVEATQNM